MMLPLFGRSIWGVEVDSTLLCATPSQPSHHSSSSALYAWGYTPDDTNSTSSFLLQWSLGLCSTGSWCLKQVSKSIQTTTTTICGNCHNPNLDCKKIKSSFYSRMLQLDDFYPFTPDFSKRNTKFALLVCRACFSILSGTQKLGEPAETTVHEHTWNFLTSSPCYSVFAED